MIDCLSNPAWINPQTDFLLFLQNYRIGSLECFDKFFLSITIFGEFWLPTLICAIAYWCIDFRAGVYLFTLEAFNTILAHLFKMIACVYRPWVLNSNIHPSELAVPFAKGYSFPSGHSAMSSSVLGGVAFLQRKNKIICALLIGLILLIGFSRLWLGVHTPQDVIVGLSIGFILVFAVNKLIDWAEKDKNRYLILAVIVNIFALVTIVYIDFFNTYRLDYVCGKLLVDPYKSVYVTIIIYGFALGLLNGLFFCRRFCPFDPKQSSVRSRIIRGLIGCAGVILLKYILEYSIMNVTPLRFTVPSMFTVGMAITLFYPLIFTFTEKLIKKHLP